MYFKYYGKYSNFVIAKTESVIPKQNKDLNISYSILQNKMTKDHIRIVCISDTHEIHYQLHVPDGDVLIHCGDVLFANSYKYSQQESINKLHSFNKWLSKLPHKYKIVVAGNHDHCLEQIGRTKVEQILTNAIYLENDSLTLKFNNDQNKIKLFCSAYSIPNSVFSPNKAFQCERNTIGDKIWSKIPDDIDILVTHQMPENYLAKDKGCKALLDIIKNKSRQCQYHIFGHWHGTYGVVFGVDNGKDFKNEYRKNVCFINCSSVDSYICAIHPPITFDINIENKYVK